MVWRNSRIFNCFATRSASTSHAASSAPVLAQKRFVFANESPYDTMDPHAAFDVGRVAVRLNLYDGLYRWLDNPPKLEPWLADWLARYPRAGFLFSHLSWHLAMGHLEAGDGAAAERLFRDAIAPGAHNGTPRQTVSVLSAGVSSRITFGCSVIATRNSAWSSSVA